MRSTYVAKGVTLRVTVTSMPCTLVDRAMSARSPGDCEGDRVEAVVDEPVGVSTQLTEVRQPRVCAFDGPAHAERHVDFDLAFAGFALLRDDQIVEADLGAQRSDDVVVVAAVEVHGVDVVEQSAGVDGVEGRLEKDAVVAVRSGDFPADRDPGPVGRDRPFPA